MERKSFFAERTAEEIRKLELSQASSQRNLVERISELGIRQGLVIKTQIIPGRFFQNVEKGTEASRKCYKHGDLIASSQPRTQQDAYACQDIPLAIRARDFSQLKKMREDEINFIGYSWYPVQGRDRRKRVIPFVWLPEAVRLFGYAETIAGGIQVKPYADAKRVQVEGAEIICEVPSRTKKMPRYKIRMQHVPVQGTTERRAVIWSLASDFQIYPEHSKWNIRYTWRDDRESSDRFTFYPHDIAAYIAIAGNYWKQHNLTPMEMNPFMIVSRKGAEFYKKLGNNILVFDPTAGGNEHLRKPHIAEKSILIARAVGIFGHDEIAYWSPERDGKLRDYDWQVK